MENTINSQFKKSAHAINVILIGGSGVGKTCLKQRLISKKFEQNSTATVGIIPSKLEVNYKGKNVVLQLVDTAGQEQFKSVSKSFYKESFAALFIFSGDSPQSLKEVEQYTRQYRIYYANSKAKQPFNPVCFFVRNKIDLPNSSFSDDVVQTMMDTIRETQDKFEAYQHIKYFKTSALTGEGSEELIQALIEELDKQDVFSGTDANETVNLYKPKNQNGNGKDGKNGEGKKCDC